MIYRNVYRITVEIESAYALSKEQLHELAHAMAVQAEDLDATITPKIEAIGIRGIDLLKSEEERLKLVLGDPPTFRGNPK